MGAQHSNLSRILIVGRDGVLLQTRRLILQQEGFSVDTALDHKEFDALVARASSPYHLWVLCHTIQEEDLQKVERAAREAKIAIYQLSSSVEPTDLLECVTTSMSSLLAQAARTPERHGL